MIWYFSFNSQQPKIINISTLRTNFMHLIHIFLQIINWNQQTNMFSKFHIISSASERMPSAFSACTHLCRAAHASQACKLLFFPSLSEGWVTQSFVILIILTERCLCGQGKKKTKYTRKSGVGFQLCFNLHAAYFLLIFEGCLRRGFCNHTPRILRPITSD